jgi:hypothetical protein
MALTRNFTGVASSIAPVRTLLLVVGGVTLSCLLGAACQPEVQHPREPPAAETELEPPPPSEPTIAPQPELAKIAPKPEPAPPEPPPFADRERVRVDELLAAISEEVEGVAASPSVRSDYEAFVVAFELQDHADQDELYLDYVRVKIAFEATRAGGWWGLRWKITNEQPNSDKIWAHWQTLDLAVAVELGTTAVAECDELSALFAFVAQRIGLSRRSEVGLLWPTGNHTVAVWTIDRKGDKPTRIVVPTSQVFLDSTQSLGTTAFNPWRQKSIFDYRRQDAADKLELPAALANEFVLAVREYGGRSQAELQELRNAREDGQVWSTVSDNTEPGAR